MFIFVHFPNEIEYATLYLGSRPASCMYSDNIFDPALSTWILTNEFAELFWQLRTGDTLTTRDNSQCIFLSGSGFVPSTLAFAICFLNAPGHQALFQKCRCRTLLSHLHLNFFHCSELHTQSFSSANSSRYIHNRKYQRIFCTSIDYQSPITTIFSLAFRIYILRPL